jgi:hypothetical protein
MAMQFEPPPSVTFSRQNQYLPNIQERDVETRQDGISRAASRNLSRASFKPPSRRMQKRNRSSLRETPEEFNLDADFMYDSDEGIRHSSSLFA